MKRFREFLIFYFIQVLLFALIFSLREMRISVTVVMNPVVWIAAAVFTLLGLFCGRAVYEVKLKPVERKDKIFRGGFIFGTVCFVAFFVLMLTSIEKPKPMTNSSKNRDAIRPFQGDSQEVYLQIALDTLESQFNTPDDFLLSAYSVRTRDTVYLGRRDTIFNIYFTYTLAADSARRFSKVSVFDSMAEMQLHNLGTTENLEYLQVRIEGRKMEQEAIQSIRESLEELPDSFRAKLADTLRHILNK
jgi:hypothetical protein